MVATFHNYVQKDKTTYKREKEKEKEKENKTLINKH